VLLELIRIVHIPIIDWEIQTTLGKGFRDVKVFVGLLIIDLLDCLPLQSMSSTPHVKQSKCCRGRLCHSSWSLCQASHGIVTNGVGRRAALEGGAELNLLVFSMTFLLNVMSRNTLQIVQSRLSVQHSSFVSRGWPGVICNVDDGFWDFGKLGGASENLKKYRAIWRTRVMLKHAFL
jgi:hypothetical protein